MWDRGGGGGRVKGVGEHGRTGGRLSGVSPSPRPKARREHPQCAAARAQPPETRAVAPTAVPSPLALVASVGLLLGAVAEAHGLNERIAQLQANQMQREAQLATQGTAEAGMSATTAPSLQPRIDAPRARPAPPAVVRTKGGSSSNHKVPKGALQEL